MESTIYEREIRIAGLPLGLNLLVLFVLLDEESGVWKVVKCRAQKPKNNDPACSARTRTVSSRVQLTNHWVTAPVTMATVISTIS